jgi:hypothetical protein
MDTIPPDLLLAVFDAVLLTRKRGRPPKNGYSKSRKNVSNGNDLIRRPVGNMSRRALRVLGEQRPDLWVKVLDGTLSPHAAMVEAGLRKRSITIPATPVEAAAAIKRHFQGAQWQEFVEALDDEQ